MFGKLKGRNYLLKIMAINFHCIESKGTKFQKKRFKTQDFVNGIDSLIPIGINNYYQVIEFFKRSKGDCFPNLPFCNLTIPKHNVSFKILSNKFCTKSYSDTHRQALS